MGTITTVTTASHRYYEKRRKSDTAFSIRSMQRALGDAETPTADLVKLKAYELARIAMSLHQRFPDEDDS